MWLPVHLASSSVACWWSQDAMLSHLLAETENKRQGAMQLELLGSYVRLGLLVHLEALRASESVHSFTYLHGTERTWHHVLWTHECRPKINSQC